MKSEVTVVEFLLTRLKQVGVKDVFGVPGDFNLVMLDDFEGSGVNFIGCANELNASYSADANARVTGGLGVLLTTFGVGELSAVNGVAGAYAERVPVLHIVGTPSVKMQSKGVILHHTLGDGKYDAFARLQSEIAVDQAIVRSVDGSGSYGQSAAEQIDRVIRNAIVKCHPTYLSLPTDLFNEKISSKPLETPLTLESIWKSVKDPDVDENLVSHVIESIVALYEKAKDPIVIVDACAVRYHILDDVRDLLRKTGMTFYSSPMGKAALDETDEHFGGVYVGAVTDPEVKERVEAADFTLSIGLLSSDFNTGSFSYKFPTKQKVELHSDHVLVQYAHYPSLGFRYFLPQLTAALAKTKSASKAEKVEGAGLVKAGKKTAESNDKLKQDEFWAVCGTHLRDGDVVLAETGTSLFGILDVKMPKNITFIGQVLWGSIGYCGGAVLGASMAASKQGRRTIMFTGEGSWMLTIQEISTVLRHGLKPICIVINNFGFTIERRIHGMDAKYNDVPLWQWQKTLEFFGAKPGESAAYRVETYAELNEVLSKKEVANAEKITLIEVIMDKYDAPRALIAQAQLTEKANAE